MPSFRWIDASTDLIVRESPDGCRSNVSSSAFTVIGSSRGNCPSLYAESSSLIAPARHFDLLRAPRSMNPGRGGYRRQIQNGFLASGAS